MKSLKEVIYWESSIRRLGAKEAGCAVGERSNDMAAAGDQSSLIPGGTQEHELLHTLVPPKGSWPAPEPKRCTLQVKMALFDPSVN